MSRPLRIAMFVGSFPVVSETFIVRQITGLIDLGHAVDIYADSRAEADAPIHPEIAKYRLLERTTFMEMPPETAPWEMPVWPIRGRTWPPGSKTSVHNAVRIARALPSLCRCLLRAPRLTRRVLSRAEYSYQAASLSALYRLANLCSRSRRYDIVHAHFGPVGNRFRFTRELWQAPLLVTFYGYDFGSVPRKEGHGVYGKLFQTADRIIAISEYARRQVEQLGCSSERLHKIPLGLCLEEFPFAERVLKPGETARILTVGRLVEKKGHEYSIRAVAKLRDQHAKVRYDILGDGPLRLKLAGLIGQLGLKDTVFLHGAGGAKSVQERMVQAHLFVLASVTAADGDQEGQGLVLQEAQASGLPVIATEHAAFPEGIAMGQSGFLVPERNVDALAERLDYLIRRPELWPAMGRTGRKHVETHYDIRALNARLVQLYTETIDAYGPGNQSGH